MAIGLSHGSRHIYASESRSDQLLVGSKDGVVVLERSAKGPEWSLAHRALTGQHISAILLDPASGLIFAGVFFGSVYASADGGKTWERRDRGLTEDDVYSLASVQINDKTRLYAGTEPAHLFYSDDLGLHWTELPGLRSVPSAPDWSFPAPPHVAHVKFISFHPDQPDTVYACIEQGALLKSTDSGESWRELNTVGFYADKNRKIEHFYDVHKMIIDPRDPQRIFVTGGAGLYVTADGGASWQRWMSQDWAADVYPDALVYDPRNPDVMFLSAAEHNPRTWRQSHYAGSRIYRTTDSGRNWEILGDGLPDRLEQEVGALCLEAWGESCSVFAATTGGDVYCSDDSGDHWSLIATGLAPIAKKGHERLLQTG